MTYKILVSDKQRFALNKLIGTVSAQDRTMRLFIISQLIGRIIQSSSEVCEFEWRAICAEAYPNRFESDWTVADAFALKLYRLGNQYREEKLGQLRLF